MRIQDQDQISPVGTADGAFLNGVLDSTMRVGHIGTWQAYPDLGVTLWSPEMYAILRLPPGIGEEPMERFQDLVIDADQPKVEHILASLQAGGSYAPITLRLRGGDGTLRHLISSGQRAPAREPGKFSFVGVNIDITEEVERKEKLALAESLLARHRSVLDSVLEHAPIGLAVSVGDEISLVSRFAADMIGVASADAVQWDAWQVYHVDGKTPAARHEQALARASLGETIRMERWKVRAADGRLIPVSCNAGPVKDDEGRIIGGVVAWYDISSFNEAEEDERAARVMAESAVRERETFAASVAHELRTPLSAVLGWIEMLHGNAGPDMTRRGLQSISTSARSMTRLLDDFLDVSRIGTGKLVIVKRPADFAAIVNSAVDTVRPLAASAGVVVDWRLGDEDLWVLADDTRMRQAILNLLTNAVKYSSEGGLVLVTAEASNQSAVLCIADYGQGIDPEDLPKIFDEFYQADRSAAKRGGLGLGLTIARHIVEGHGGSITAESSGPGRGASFTIRLPLS